MRSRKGKILTGVLSIFLISMIGLFGADNNDDGFASAQTDVKVPEWIKTLAKYWSENGISDREFVSAIEFLVKDSIITSDKIMIVEIDTIDDNSNQEPTIPHWIRNNALWFYEGTITERDFVSGIEFMIESEIIQSNRIQIVDESPIVDSDNDGINDDVDDCPNVPELVNGFEDNDGCPDEVPIVDSDNDGINDDVDDCPNVPETINGFEDDDGCPDEIIVTNNESNNGLADKSLTISNVEISPPANSGWGDPRITLSWTYFVDHVDESNAGFPTEGHFIIEIVGVKTVRSEANYVSDNIFFGEFDKIDPGADGGPVTITIISFEGDDRGVYVGDGDQQEIIIPPFDPEE